MNRAILSPCLLKVDQGCIYEEQQEHAMLLADLLDYMYKYCNIQFEDYRKAPYDGYRMEIPRYSSQTLNNYVTTNIFSKIQKMLVKDQYVDLENIEPATCISSIELEDDSFTEAFLRYINYAHDEEVIMFIGKKNMLVERPFKFRGASEFNVNTSTEADIELSTVLLPFLKECNNYDEIFPRKNACYKYNEYVLNKSKDMRLNQSEKISLFESVGDLVARYNYYERDEHLCRLNKSRKRKVYRKEKGKLYYFSIDIESGGIEVFDENFKHLGQYNFSGELAKPAEPTTHWLYH